MVEDLDPADLLGPHEAAVMLRVQPQTLATWRITGRGPPFYKIGGKVYYHPKEIKSWLAAQRRGDD